MSKGVGVLMLPGSKVAREMTMKDDQMSTVINAAITPVRRVLEACIAQASSRKTVGRRSNSGGGTFFHSAMVRVSTLSSGSVRSVAIVSRVAG